MSIEEIKVDSREDKCLIYGDPKLNMDKLKVRVGACFWNIGDLDVAAGTARGLFDIWLVYESKIFDQIFYPIRDNLPWIIPNALELSVDVNDKYYMKGDKLESLVISRKQQDIDLKDSRLFTVEVYTIRARLKLISFPSEDPFQSIFFVCCLALDSTPGVELVEFMINRHIEEKKEEYRQKKVEGPNNTHSQKATDCYFPGFHENMGEFSKINNVKTREVQIPDPHNPAISYSRLYFICEYQKSPREDLMKYYVLPLCINGLTIAFYDSVGSLFESAGAYFLAIIALLFTLPENGAFTRNEKAVVFGSIWMLIELFALIGWDSIVTQIILGIALFVSYIGLICVDYIKSKQRNDEYRVKLFERDLNELDVL